MLAEVVSLEKDKTWFVPVGLDEEDLKTELILGLGLTRPATMDMIVGKATELGVSQILPLLTARSFRLPSGKLSDRKCRWERIARSALKQSKGAILPVIKEAGSLEAILPDLEAEQKIFLDESSQAYFRDILRKRGHLSHLAGGPEGG
jgi:16S rRNA (uracil1498-N3)-methyltransferase